MYRTWNHNREFIRRLVTTLILLAAGFLFLYLPTDPGTVSNAVAYLETDGKWISHSLGILLLLLGIAGVLSLSRVSEHKSLRQKRKSLIYSVDQELFGEIAQKLWSEFFNRPDLSCTLLLKKGRMYITGDVPKDFDDKEQLADYLTKNMLTLSGYFGEISLLTQKIT